MGIISFVFCLYLVAELGQTDNGSEQCRERGALRVQRLEIDAHNLVMKRYECCRMRSK